MLGTWHAGQPGSITDHEIQVNGGHWSWDFVGFGASSDNDLLITLAASSSGSIYAGTYGSTEGATYDSEHDLWLVPAHITEAQKAALIYNETKGIDPSMQWYIAALLYQVIQNREGDRYLAASTVSTITNHADFMAYQYALSAPQVLAKIATIPQLQQSNGATNWIMYETQGTHIWRGLTPVGYAGPFGSNGSPYHYVYFYKDPAYAN